MIKFLKEEKERKYIIYAVLSATRILIDKERGDVDSGLRPHTKFFESEKERDINGYGTTVPAQILVPIVIVLILFMVVVLI